LKFVCLPFAKYFRVIRLWRRRLVSHAAYMGRQEVSVEFWRKVIKNFEALGIDKR
jgi:hypothetical protein